ncbi:MAG: haloacid dehalogenase-like hydrolase [Spirochaetes bacterium]|nr:haloacid dehalogenase-like hydrolase [Spirochaetota bacterium]
MQDIIAVVFDFDDTLTPDSTSSYLEFIGADIKRFWSKNVQNLIVGGWDPVPAYLFEMIKLSRSGSLTGKITRESLIRFGKNIKFYPGVTQIFSRLKKYAAVISNNVAVEFYIISSGIGEILKATKIAKYFQDIWASDFHYADNDTIDFPRNIVSFTDKTRYIFHVSKGVYGTHTRGRPFEVNRKIPSKELRIPMDQIIFVGDGYTDIPCFSLVTKSGGVAIGVYDKENREKWGKAWGFIEDGRVSNLVPADYTSRSALSNSLMMAVESIANRIAIRQSSYQG